MVNLTKFAKEVGDLTIKPALDRMLSLLNGFADLIGPKNFFGLGETIGTAVYQGMGKIISGPGLLLLGAVLIKIGARLAVFVKDAAAGFMGMETASQKLASTQTVIQNILAQRPALINQATASEEGMVAVARVLAQKLKESRAEMEKLTLAAQKAAPAVLAMQGGAKSKGGRRSKKVAGGFIPSFSMGAASGFVPNFNQAAAEKRMAQAGGYQAGKIREATIPGVGKVTYNGNETVKQFPGMQQQAIMPPNNSPAGKNYRESFRNMHGYDPYNSASGFVPNFASGKTGMLTVPNPRGGAPLFAGPANKLRYAKGLTDAQRGSALREDGTPYRTRAQLNIEANKRGAERDPAYRHQFDTRGRIGMVAFKGAAQNSASASMPISSISALKELRGRFPELDNDKIQFNGMQIRTASSLSKAAGKGDGEKFFKRISDEMSAPLTNLADYFSKEILGNDGLPSNQKTAFEKAIKNKESFLNPGTEGDIFEQVIRILTTNPTMLAGTFDDNKNFQQPFDFEEVGRVSPTLRKTFGFKRNLHKADAKRKASNESIQSLIKKSFNQAVLHPGELGKMFTGNSKTALPGIGKNISAGGTGVGGRMMKNEVRSAASRIGKPRGVASGFVPNFAAVMSSQGSGEAASRVGALGAAIEREDRAGVRRDQVRVGFDKRLNSGVGVYNTGEGSLGNAINMHLASGASMRSIQTMGKAMGHIPNFADKGGGIGGGAGLGLLILGPQLQMLGEGMKNATTGVNTFTGSLLTTIGSMTTWLYPLQMVGDMVGGWGNALSKTSGFLKNFGSTMRAAKNSTLAYIASQSLGGGLKGSLMGRTGVDRLTGKSLRDSAGKFTTRNRGFGDLTKSV